MCKLFAVVMEKPVQIDISIPQKRQRTERKMDLAYMDKKWIVLGSFPSDTITSNVLVLSAGDRKRTKFKRFLHKDNWVFMWDGIIEFKTHIYLDGKYQKIDEYMRNIKGKDKAGQLFQLCLKKMREKEAGEWHERLDALSEVADSLRIDEPAKYLNFILSDGMHLCVGNKSYIEEDEWDEWGPWVEDDEVDDEKDLISVERWREEMESKVSMPILYCKYVEDEPIDIHHFSDKTNILMEITSPRNNGKIISSEKMDDGDWQPLIGEAMIIKEHGMSGTGL